jgi:hypothetical protein
MAGKAREVGADAISITGVDTRIGPATRVPALDEDVAVDEYYATQEGEFRMRRSGRSGWRIEPYTVTHRDRIVTARFLKLDEE